MMKNEMRLKAEGRVQWKFKHSECRHFDKAEYEDIECLNKLKDDLNSLITYYMDNDNRLGDEEYGSIHYAIGTVKNYLTNAIKECEDDIEKFDHEYFEVEDGYND